MTYPELKKLFQTYESDQPKTHLTAYITFSSFGPDVPVPADERSQTYVISSDNKAFQPNKGGYSIFGCCLDGTDQGVRLERYMQAEHGGETGWVAEDCCLVAYLLSRTCERDIGRPLLFYDHNTARVTMLRELCTLVEMDYDVARKEYLKNNHQLGNHVFGAGPDSAWVNDTPDGNRDWSIQPVRVYDLLRITTGDLYADTEEDA